MIREIKFRVFCEKHNRWEYYSLGDIICGAATSSNGEGGEFKADTWTQFTGLHDKQGKEIFEGDIIETPELNIIEVFFGEKVYRFGKDIVQCFGWVARNKSGHTETLDDSMFGKIIGNIYEQPHLLNL